MATSTPANASSPANIIPGGPPPAITTACSVNNKLMSLLLIPESPADAGDSTAPAGSCRKSPGVELSDGRSLRAKYLVGCDGGRSLIRKKAGINFPGWDPSTSYLIAEVEMAEEPELGIRRGEKGINALAKLTSGSATSRPCAMSARRSLSSTGRIMGLRSATYVSRFTDMARQAASCRDRRVLLAGDAAHVHSPKGGQGLNIGVQDAVSLG
jgi:2-polyprenyl-6-methoxyphenol hydroxylase-like FAD-dependent oxidoreductase